MTAAIAAVSMTSINSHNAFLLGTYATKTWYHYLATPATSSYGCKEYWTDCYGTTQLTEPDSGNIVENGSGNGDAIVSGYGTDDERIINRFGSDVRFHGYRVSNGAITVDGLLNDSAYSGLTANYIDTNLWQSGDGQNISANFYVAYDDQYLYLAFDVLDSQPEIRDFSASSGDWTEADDAIEIRLDLLHSTSQANGNWNGGWGGDYRGDIMCEAFAKFAAGYDPTDSSKAACYGNRWGDGIGCEFAWDYWWSNNWRNDGKTTVVSKTNANGYTAEMKIDIEWMNALVKPGIKMEIGLGVKIYNKTSTGGQTILVGEGMNDGMSSTPRNCSTVVLH